MIDNNDENVANKLIEKFFPNGDYHLMYSLLTSTFDNDEIKIIYDFAVKYGDEILNEEAPKETSQSEIFNDKELPKDKIYWETKIDRHSIYNYEFDKETMERVYEEMFKKHQEEFQAAAAKPPVDDVLANDPNWQIQHKLFWDYIDEHFMADFYRDLMGVRDPAEITKLIYGNKEAPEGFKKKMLLEYGYEVPYQETIEEVLPEALSETPSNIPEIEEYIEPLTAADFEPGELEKIHETFDRYKTVKRHVESDTNFLVKLWHFQKNRYQRKQG